MNLSIFVTDIAQDDMIRENTKKLGGMLRICYSISPYKSKPVSPSWQTERVAANRAGQYTMVASAVPDRKGTNGRPALPAKRFDRAERNLALRQQHDKAARYADEDQK